MRRKRLNVTRRCGRLFFRRETSRLMDGTPDGEVLWVFNSDRKPRKAVPVRTFTWRTTGVTDVSALLGTYRIMRAVPMAREIRGYLFGE